MRDPNVVSLELRPSGLIIIPRDSTPRSCPFKEIDKILVDKAPQSIKLHTKRGETVEFRFPGARDLGLAINARCLYHHDGLFLVQRQHDPERPGHVFHLSEDVRAYF